MAAAVGQSPDTVLVACAVGVEDGRPTERVPGVDVGAMMDEVVDDLFVRPVGSDVQEVALTWQAIWLAHLEVHVDAGLQHGFENFFLASQCACVDWRPAVHFGCEHLDRIER